MKANFVREIKHLLAKVPAEQWAGTDVCGLMYELLPWHNMSSVTVQTREDDPHDTAAWRHYFSAESDTSRIRQEIEHYRTANDWRVYHALLIEAAEALLDIDFAPYGQALTVTDGRPFKPFQVQVYHADETFDFNYCEYVLARRLELG